MFGLQEGEQTTKSAENLDSNTVPKTHEPGARQEHAEWRYRSDMFLPAKKNLKPIKIC